jgi:organic radical activating enzyme
MKKIFPIKVEKVFTQKYKFVEWKIHNVCNYNCRFCGSKHKDGSDRWFDLETYKIYADKIINSCSGEPLWIQFTGGEPTLFPNLIELMDYFKKRGAYISLVSNGSRTLRWWKELQASNTVDFLTISYHPDMTSDYRHIIEILNLFHNVPVITSCLVTHSENTIDAAIDAASEILENTGAYVSINDMRDAFYDVDSTCTEEQLLKLKEFDSKLSKKIITKVQGKRPGINTALKITYDDLTQRIINPQTIIKNGENIYKGWKCDIGVNILRIDHKTIFKGVCEVDGPITDLDSAEMIFQKDPTICTKSSCTCPGLDMMATKVR